MIDINATLNEYFSQVIKYLTKIGTKARSQRWAEQNSRAIASVLTIAGNPRRFYDYQQYSQLNILNVAAGFIPEGSNDNRVLLDLTQLMSELGDLESDFDFVRQKKEQQLFSALKRVKYINSTNIFKYFIYPMMSPEYYAIKTKNDKSH